MTRGCGCSRLRFGPILLLLLAIATAASAADRVVDLTASDGTRLKATYYPAAKPGPGVLLLHQCNRDRTVWNDLAQQLSAAGINVLTLDYRGFGESGGTPFAKATQAEAAAEQAKWPGDIEVAFQYLVAQPGVTKDTIGVGGASCGFDNSVQTALRHPEVRSLVLLSGQTDRKGRQFLRTSTNVPELFGVADDDEFGGTVLVVEWQYYITGNPGKRLVHYSTGGHGADMFRVHPEFKDVITDWYVTTLIKTPGQAPASHDTFTVTEQIKLLGLLDEPGGAAKVGQIIEAERRRNSNFTLFPENLINLLGYEFIQAGDKQDAIEVMKLNVQAYPNSPNVYDSLSDAYFADGQKELARENARKALQLLATDRADPQAQRDAIKANSEMKLKQLGDAPQ